ASRDAAVAGRGARGGDELHRLRAPRPPIVVSRAGRLSRDLRVLRRREGAVPAADRRGALDPLPPAGAHRARDRSRVAQRAQVPAPRVAKRLPEQSVQRSLRTRDLDGAGAPCALLPDAARMEDSRPRRRVVGRARSRSLPSTRLARPASRVARDAQALAGAAGTAAAPLRTAAPPRATA